MLPRRRPSTIDRLPSELRELIARLRSDGATIDEILAQLHARGTMVARTALGRHTQRLDAVSELGMAQELLALRREISGLGKALRAEIGRAGGEVQLLRAEIDAFKAVILEERRST